MFHMLTQHCAWRGICHCKHNMIILLVNKEYYHIFFSSLTHRTKFSRDRSKFYASSIKKLYIQQNGKQERYLVVCHFTILYNEYNDMCKYVCVGMKKCACVSASTWVLVWIYELQCMSNKIVHMRWQDGTYI